MPVCRCLSFLSSLFLFQFVPVSLFAQDYFLDAQLLTTNDGLSNLMTHAIHQDRRGYMWIGTPYGLNRYDGYSFNNYTMDEHGLHENENIRGIMDDEAGNLWLFYSNSGWDGVAHAIDIFNPKTEKAIPLEKYFKEGLPFKVAEINYPSTIDPKNRLWLTTTKGELFLYEKGKFQKKYDHNPTLIQYVTIDTKDRIWLGYDKEVVCVDQSGKLLEQYKLDHYTHGIWEGEDQTMWLAGSLGRYGGAEIVVWNKKKDANGLERFTFSDEKGAIELKDVDRIFIYRSHRSFWYINTKNQFYVFDNHGRQLGNFNPLINIQNIRPVYLKYVENEDYVWFCTARGVLKTSVKRNPFRLIHQTKGDLSDCRGITEDESGNIYFLNRALFQWRIQNNASPRLISREHSGHALTYKDSIFYIGTYNPGLLGYKLDLKTKRQTPIPSLNGTNIYCAIMSKDVNKLLIGTDAGLEYIQLKNDKVLPFEKQETGNPQDALLKKSTVYHLHQNASGIWAATSKGVFWVNENKGVLAHFDDTNALPFNYIRHIHEDEDGFFWLATKGGGVIKWRPAQNGKPAFPAQQFTVKNGLSNDYLYAIYEDGYDRLWIPSDRGIMCMDRNTQQILKTYLVEDGLAHNEFNTSSHFQAKDGTLYFGGLGGLIAFHPNSIPKASSNQIPLEFISLKVLESGAKEMTNRTRLLETTDEIVIKPTDKLFEIKFALLDYDNPERRRYSFQIQGYTDYWQALENNYIRITNLPFGHYTLKIRGGNVNKGWSEHELELKIRVLAPFYLRWWFITILSLILIGAVAAFVKWSEVNLKKEQERLEAEIQNRTLTIQRQTEELKELDKAKTLFFSNITHEFRTPLTLIIGPLEQLLSEHATVTFRRRLYGVIKNAQHLLNLINQLLDLSKLESGHTVLEVSHGDIVEFTKDIVSRFHPLALQKELQLTTVFEHNTWETNFDKDKWNKIVYNLLSNAIKFTPPGGAIQLSLSKIQPEQENAFIQFSVKDTGIGIEKEYLSRIFERFYQTDSSSTRVKGGTGIGLALVKELVELQGGEIKASSEAGKGTTFNILLPILKRTTATSSGISPEKDDIPLPIIENMASSPPAHPSLLSNDDKLELLIIEDNDEMREYIRYCIDAAQYNVTEAADGEEGLQKAQALIPDLIISDVMMPKKDGFELVKSIRDNISTSHIPLVLLTAKATLESRLEGLRRGADAYLTKPFSPQELAVRIHKLIEMRRQLQQRYKIGTMPPNDEAHPLEDEFIARLRNYILENIDENDLGGDRIGRHFGMSRGHLHRKLKALTDHSITEFVRIIRLQKALELIKEGKLNLSEIAYQTGFSSISYFSRSFKKVYGKSPSEM